MLFVRRVRSPVLLVLSRLWFSGGCWSCCCPLLCLYLCCRSWWTCWRQQSPGRPDGRCSIVAHTISTRRVARTGPTSCTPRRHTTTTSITIRLGPAWLPSSPTQVPHPSHVCFHPQSLCLDSYLWSLPAPPPPLLSSQMLPKALSNAGCTPNDRLSHWPNANNISIILIIQIPRTTANGIQTYPEKVGLILCLKGTKGEVN